MPFRFKSLSHPDVSIYVGFDKYENEDLIKYAWNGDIWFHVDKHSSAHVYLRPPVVDPLALHNHECDEKWKFPDIPADLLEEVAQLTKENSIEGCKLDNLTIIYTPAENLRKDGTMEIGTVGFVKDKLVKRYHVKEKNKDMLKALEKTKVADKETNLMNERDMHERWLRKQMRAVEKLIEKENREIEADKRREKQARDYTATWDCTNYTDKDVCLTGTKNNPQALFDDFI